MVNDQLSDFVARVNNGYMAGRKDINMPSSRIVESVANVLKHFGYIEELSKVGTELVLTLKYKSGEPAIMGMRRMSRPGARVYSQVKDLPKVWGGLGMNILSTPKGVMGDKEAKKINTGGELLIQVW